MKKFAAQVLALLVVSLARRPLAAQTTAPKPPKFEDKAILVWGSEAVKGLPNFGKNALPAIYGEYQLKKNTPAPTQPGTSLPVTSQSGPSQPEAAIRVWMTNEALHLAASVWKPGRLAAQPAVWGAYTPESQTEPLTVYLFDHPFPQEGLGARPRAWSVLLAFPPETLEKDKNRLERFTAVFMNRLAFFLSNAKAAEDVSFPAVFDF